MDKEITTLRAKIAILRQENTELRQELQNLKHETDDETNQAKLFDYSFGREI